MPRNPTTGVYTAPASSVNPAQTRTRISSTDFNGLVDDFEAALNGVVLAGQPQSLPDEQQYQARENVGAAPDASLDCAFYATKATVEATNVPSRYNVLFISGYSSAGDGGGAFYKRVEAESSHAGKIQDSAGAWWEIEEPVYSVKMFGAKGDSTGTGVGTDDRAAFQGTFNAAISKRKKVHIPGAAYRIGSPGLTADLSANTGATEPRLSIEGDGRGTTLLYFDTGDYTGLHWISGTSGSGVHGVSTIRGFYLRKSDLLGTGLKIENAAFMSVCDVYCSGWNDGISLVDCLSSRFEGVLSRFNNYGLRAARDNGSQPNAIALISSVLGNNQENAAVLTRPGNFSMVGGSVESNGALGDDATKGGIYITEGPSQAGNSLTMTGVYVEGNVGDADITVSNSSGFQATYAFFGCSFQRISGANFTTNILKATGTTEMVFSFKGCAFKRLGSYVADAGRPYVNVSGASAATVDMDRSNYQMDSVEAYTQPAVTIAEGGTGATTQGAARTALGVGTGDSPQFAALNIGHASDTTITRTGAGDLAVEGNAIYRAGGADVPVADGGTGAGTARGASQNLGYEYVLDASFAGWTTQSTSEAALRTITIPAGAMGPNGYISIESWWEGVGTTDTKTIRGRFNGISGTQYLAMTLTNTQLSHKDDRIIANAGSASTQVGGINSQGNGGGWGSSTATGSSSSVDTSAAVDLVLSGQVTNAADTIRLRGYIVKVCYRP